MSGDAFDYGFKPKRFIEYRRLNNLTQQAVADKLRVGVATVRRWEAGKREPSLCKLVAISNLLEVGIGYLLGITDIPQRMERLTDIEWSYVLMWRKHESERCKVCADYRAHFDHFRAALLRKNVPKK